MKKRCAAITIALVGVMLLFSENPVKSEPAFSFYQRGTLKLKTAFGTGNYEEALEELNKAIEQYPNYSDAFFVRGDIKNLKGDTIGAIDDYSKGLEIDPNHKGINEYLGELYVATNRIDLAKERLKILGSCNCEEYT